MLDPNTEQILRWPQVSVDLAPVTNMMHLAMRLRIISLITTGKIPGALSRAMSQNATISCMYAQEGYLLAIHSVHLYSS